MYMSASSNTASFSPRSTFIAPWWGGCLFYGIASFFIYLLADFFRKKSRSLRKKNIHVLAGALGARTRWVNRTWCRSGASRTDAFEFVCATTPTPTLTQIASHTKYPYNFRTFHFLPTVYALTFIITDVVEQWWFWTRANLSRRPLAKGTLVYPSEQEYIRTRDMQHHTLGSGTAEFQVTWPPKLREGTYLVKNIRARFEYRKTIAAHEKQVIMKEKAQPCASLWRKTLRPKRVGFLSIDVDYVCLPLYHLTFLPLCNLSASFCEEKRKKKRDKRVQVSSINSWHESAVYRAALPHRHTILYNTQKSRYLKFRCASALQWRDQALHTLVLMHSWSELSGSLFLYPLASVAETMNLFLGSFFLTPGHSPNFHTGSVATKHLTVQQVEKYLTLSTNSVNQTNHNHLPKGTKQQQQQDRETPEWSTDLNDWRFSQKDKDSWMSGLHFQGASPCLERRLQLRDCAVRPACPRPISLPFFQPPLSLSLFLSQTLHQT